MLGLNSLSLKQVSGKDLLPEFVKESKPGMEKSFLDMLSGKIEERQDNSPLKSGAEAINTALQEPYKKTADEALSTKIDENKNQAPDTARLEPKAEETRSYNPEHNFLRKIAAKAGSSLKEMSSETEKSEAPKTGIRHELKVKDIHMQHIDVPHKDNQFKLEIPVNMEKSAKATEKNSEKKVKQEQADSTSDSATNALFYRIENLLNILKNSRGQASESKELKDLYKDINAFIKKSPGEKDSAKIKQIIKDLQAAIEKLPDMKMSDKIITRDLAATLTEVAEKVKVRNTKSDSRKSEMSLPLAESVARTPEIMDQKKTVTAKSGAEDKESAGNFNGLFERAGFNNKKMDFNPAKTAVGEAFYDQLQKMMDQAKVTVRDSQNGTFSVRMNPKELGSVNVNIGLEDGVVSGKFLVDTQEAKDLLVQNLNIIKSELEQSGISVGEFQVNVKNQQEMFDNNDGDGKSNGTASVKPEGAEEEYEIVSAMKHDGSLDVII